MQNEGAQELNADVTSKFIADAEEPKSNQSTSDGPHENDTLLSLEQPSTPAPRSPFQLSNLLRNSLYVCLASGYFAYLVTAMVIDWRRALPLFLASLLVALWKLGRAFRSKWKSFSGPFRRWYHKAKTWIWAVPAAAVVGAFIWFVVSAGIKRPQRLLALLGITVFHGVAFLCSTNPRAVVWRPVLWGLVLQVAVALFILQTRAGLVVFGALGAAMDRCLQFSDVGAEFVFGPNFADHFFAFKILPSITFFSALVALLYYYGVMQFLIRGCAIVMSETLGLSPCETIVGAANIFIGMTSAPLLVKPLLPEATPSELHCMMVTGFATITGSMVAVYGALDIPTSHLLAASVMSAPAALGIAKLLCPEDRKPAALGEWKSRCPERNALEAVANGAIESIPLVASVAVMLITFVGLVAMANALLSWFGSLVNYPELSFDRICSFVFLPVALVMGVEWKDAFEVASLLGTKTIINEFVAYVHLSELIKAGTISKYSILIASYSLCGFSNLGAVGSTVAMFAMLVPARTAEVSELAPRALLGGTLACFCTACVAGLIYDADAGA